MYSFYIIKMAQDKSRVNEVLFLHQIRGNFDFLGSLSKFAFCRRVAAFRHKLGGNCLILSYDPSNHEIINYNSFPKHAWNLQLDEILSWKYPFVIMPECLDAIALKNIPRCFEIQPILSRHQCVKMSYLEKKKRKKKIRKYLSTFLNWIVVTKEHSSK